MRDYTYPTVLVIAHTLFRALAINRIHTGQEHIPKVGGGVIASNHIGYVDWVFNGAAAAKRGRVVRFMAKKEAFEGWVGTLMRSFHHIPVDRENGEGALLQAIEYAKAGELVGIFPEATISRSFEIKECKTGAVRIAAEAGVPLIPMIVWGTQLLKTKDHPAAMWARKRTLILKVGAPVEVTGDPVADTARLRSELQRLLDEAISEYPIAPQGQWWAPARLGGLAPTPQQAAQLDAEEKAARAATRAARDNR